MLRIYLPSYNGFDAPMYLSLTSSTHGHSFVTVFTSRHLGPNIWVLANGSKMICQPLGHLLGPGSSHTGLGIWVFSMSDLIFMYLVLKKKKIQQKQHHRTEFRILEEPPSLSHGAASEELDTERTERLTERNEWLRIALI